MHDERKTLAVEIEIQPGEKLSLPPDLIEKIGLGRWIVTIEPIANENPGRSHGAFLNSSAPEDEGVYDDCSGRRNAYLEQQSDDYTTMAYVLGRPRMLFPPANSLHVVLALVHGIALERFPPHGSNFLPGFSEFVGRRFHAPITNHYITLIEQFGDLPWQEGCKAVLSLLEEWRAHQGEQSLRNEP